MSYLVNMLQQYFAFGLFTNNIQIHRMSYIYICMFNLHLDTFFQDELNQSSVKMGFTNTALFNDEVVFAIIFCCDF